MHCQVSQQVIGPVFTADQVKRYPQPQSWLQQAKSNGFWQDVGDANAETKWTAGGPFFHRAGELLAEREYFLCITHGDATHVCKDKFATGTAQQLFTQVVFKLADLITDGRRG